MKGVNFINQGRAEAQRPKKKKEIYWAKEGDPANKIIFESPPTKNMRSSICISGSPRNKKQKF